MEFTIWQVAVVEQGKLINWVAVADLEGEVPVAVAAIKLLAVMLYWGLAVEVAEEPQEPQADQVPAA
jgi:hypothetical protein